MKYMLTIVSVTFVAAVMLSIIIPLENQLDDCRFEVNHLQTKLDRLQELSDYVPAMEQILPPLVLAQLKVANEMILKARYKNYERHEQPIIDN